MAAIRPSRDVGESKTSSREREEAKRRKKEAKGTRKKAGKHTRMHSYGGTGNIMGMKVTDEPTAFTVWIPGVGYVIDSGGIYTPPMSPAMMSPTQPDLHMPRVKSETQLSACGAPSEKAPSDKDARRRRRREEQRRNRSKKDKVKDVDKDSDAGSISTASTCLDGDESFASSSPTLSYSSPSSSVNSSVIHTRSGSQIGGFGGLTHIENLQSSLAPEVLADLLSMAAW